MPPTARGTAIHSPLAFLTMIFCGMSARLGTDSTVTGTSQSSFSMPLKEPSQPAT